MSVVSGDSSITVENLAMKLGIPKASAPLKIKPASSPRCPIYHLVANVKVAHLPSSSTATAATTR